MIGTTVGRYEIVAKLGAGGMGEVYRARDPRLGRDVAVKVLAPALHADPAAVSRFEQEARAASALQHPAIVTVYDIGTENGQPYLVTELLEGSTLRERLRKGAMSVREALDVAIHVAQGLAAAHRAGIVHRDIKPENLFLTRTGARILDFGIARLVSTRRIPSDSTPTELATSAGMMVGTVGYMAPEQVRGGDVDARADLFALGCVLHEMLSGRKAFGGNTAMDTLAAILSEPPAALPPPPAVPASLARLVGRCLEKDPDERCQSARDLAFALADLREDPVQSAPAGAGGGPSRWVVWGSLATALLAAALAGVAWTSRPEAPGPMVLDTQTLVTTSMRPIAPAIAPDGKWIAYVSTAGERPSLLVQFLSGGPPVNLTRDTNLPIQNRSIVGGIDISPDGTAIGVAGPPRPTGLWTIPGVFAIPAPLGGPPQRVGEGIASIRWSPDGKRIAAIQANPLTGDAVVVANADGSDSRVLVPMRGGVHMHQVAWSADGQHVYYARSIEGGHTLGDIYRVAVTGGAPEIVVRTPGVAMHPAPTPDGRALLYAGDRNGEGMNIWMHPFDGSPEVRITTCAGEYTEPYVSRDGTALVCIARRRTGEIVRVDVSGSAAPGAVTNVGAPGSSDGEPSVSPASDRIFITSTRNGRRRIWSVDATGGSARPLTTGDALDWWPAVSPDSTRVAFLSNRDGKRGVWTVAADGGTPKRVAEGEVLERVSWSPDSRRIVYAMAGDTNSSLWTVGADGGTPRPVPGVTGRVPAWSPRGDTIAIFAATNGRPELHFVSETGANVRPPLPIDPVSHPRAISWSPDGTRLAVTNLPGRAVAEVWLLTLGDGSLRQLHQFPAPAELDGVTWTPDGKAVLVGRRDFEHEVLLIRGLKPTGKP